MSRHELSAAIAEDIRALRDVRDGLRSTVLIATDDVWDIPAPADLHPAVAINLEAAFVRLDGAVFLLRAARRRIRDRQR